MTIESRTAIPDEVLSRYRRFLRIEEHAAAEMRYFNSLDIDAPMTEAQREAMNDANDTAEGAMRLLRAMQARYPGIEQEAS